MAGALEDLMVLDLTSNLSGPYCAMMLADHGADVIKIEQPETGDAARNMPPFVNGESAPFMIWNRNKRSVTLDLKKDREAFLKLVDHADFVVENFRAGVMQRLGLDWKALHARNPRLILGSISGFGQTGPYSHEAGYDGKIQALSGIMSITGHPAMGPTRAGFAVCDVLSGMTAAFAVASALYQRTHTGEGQFIDVSMLEASLAFLSTQVADFTVAGHRQEQFGNQAISRKVTANLFRAKDSYLLLAVNDEKQFRALMTALRRTDVFDDPRFGDWFQRKENEAALREIIETALAHQDAKAWEKQLNVAGAPSASIWTIEEVISHPQIVAREVMQSVQTQYGMLRLMGSGFQMAHGGGHLDTAPPELGADTDTILAGLGYDPAAIAALRAEGVV